MRVPVVPYFLSSVTDVVGPFMGAAGLERSGTDVVGATWDDARAAVRLSYYPEEAPNYTMNVAVAAKTGGGPAVSTTAWP